MNTKTEKNRRFFAAAAAILAAALLLGLLPLLGAGAHAETSGVYTYEVADGKATITRCDTAVSGALTIPAKLGGYPVTAIGDEAFWQCYDLTKVTIPSGVTEIGTAAFGRCNALTEVVLPAGLVRLGTRAFFDCCSLTAITLPESLKIIEDGAFRACTALTALAIPKNVEAIGMGAFWSCIALNDLTVDPANGEFVMQGGVLYDKAKTTLVAAPAAASVSIPSTVTTIQDFAFAGNYAMTSVTIPASVTKVAYGQFEDCVNLTSVSLPAGTTEIGDYSFYGCEALRQIAIPDGVTYIGFCSFQLSGLTDVTIPASVFVLNTDAFKLCPDLKTVRIAKGVDTIGHEVFGWCPALTEIWCGAAEKPLNWCDDWLGENDPAPTVHWGELAPPTDVTAKGLTSGGIKVSWTLSEGATKYNVYRKVSGGSWENIGYSRTNSYTDTTAEAGTLYYYRVRAQVSKTYSAYSANASARWLAAPAAPTLTNYTSGIKAVWGEVKGATIYYVWRAEGSGAYAKIGSSRTTSYVDKTAVAGKTYRYAVKVRVSDTYSALGAEAKTVRLETPAVTIKAYASGIKLTWTKVPGATLYNIWRASPGGTYEKIDFSRTLSYVDRTVESGKAYSYYVVAQVSKFVSAHSNTVTATAK